MYLADDKTPLLTTDDGSVLQSAVDDPVGFVRGSGTAATNVGDDYDPRHMHILKLALSLLAGQGVHCEMRASASSDGFYG